MARGTAAGVAEQADATVSNTVEGNLVRVQVSSPAPYRQLDGIRRGRALADTRETPRPGQRARRPRKSWIGGHPRCRRLRADVCAPMAPSTRRRTAASVASVLLPHPDGSRSVRCYVSGMTRAEVVRKLDDPKREGPNAFAAGKTTGTTRRRGSSLSGRGSARRHTASTPGTSRTTGRRWPSRPLTRLTPAHVESTMPGSSVAACRHRPSAKPGQPSAGPCTTPCGTGS